MNNLKNLIGAILASSLAAAKSAGSNEVPKQEIIERLRSMGIEAEFVTPEEFHSNTGCSCGNCGNNEPDLSFADALASMLADYDGEDVPQAPTPPQPEMVSLHDVFARMFGCNEPEPTPAPTEAPKQDASIRPQPQVEEKLPTPDQVGELELKLMDAQCALDNRDEEIAKLRDIVLKLQTECGRLHMALLDQK